MGLYKILDEPGMHWVFLADDSFGFPTASAQNISDVLRCVTNEFQQIFGNSVLQSHPILTVLRWFDDPCTYRENNLIFLSCHSQYYLAYIYKFSHELCHFMVPGRVCQRFRWLEETLCNLMSLFMLQRIQSQRSSHPLDALVSLYPYIDSYLSASFTPRYNLRGQSLSSFVARHLDLLEEYEYNRELNRTVAVELLPLFEEFESLWHLVPCLDQLSSEMSLPDALRFLCTVSGIEESGSEQLINRLTQ